MSSPGSLTHPSLSVVIPLFNEEEILPLLIKSLFETLSDNPAFHELVLVDDGSRDRTADLAREFAARDHRIRLIQHPVNRGLGAAIRTGFEAATGHFVLYTDADLPFDFKLIPQLLHLAREDRLVMGCRLNRGEGIRRWILTKGYNLLCRFLLGGRIQDINFACKLISTSALRRMHLESEGSFIDAEILLESRRQKLEVLEFPMTYFPRQIGVSTLSRPGVIWGILREMCSYLSRTSRDSRQPMLPAHHLWRYALSSLGAVTALCLILMLKPFIALSPLIYLIPVTFLATWRFGLGPGFWTILLSLLLAQYILFLPGMSLTSMGTNRSLWLLLFLLPVVVTPLRNGKL